MKVEKEQMLLRIPERLKNRLKDNATEQGISLNALITQMLWRYLENKERR